MYVKTDVEGLVKDTKSGAVLNVDGSKLQAYKKQKAFIEERSKDGERLNRVENDLNEIKTLLHALLRENSKW